MVATAYDFRYLDNEDKFTSERKRSESNSWTLKEKYFQSRL